MVPWLTVAAETARLAWLRRGDAGAQAAAVAGVLATLPWADRGLALTQAGAVAVGVVAAWLLGLAAGHRGTRNRLVLAAAGLAGGATVLGHPELGNVIGLVPALLGAAVASYAPHPDDTPTTPRRDPDDVDVPPGLFDDAPEAADPRVLNGFPPSLR